MNELTPVSSALSSAEGLTAAEFMVMIEAGVFSDSKVELADGVIIKMAPAGSDHAFKRRP